MKQKLIGELPSRQRLFYILLVFLCGLPLVRCDQKTALPFELRYYANLSGVVSPYLEYHPQGLISKSTAEDLGRYYQFTYSGDTLMEIRFFKRNRPDDQAYFQAHCVKYEYGERTYSRRYFDQEGNPAIMWRHYYQGGAIHAEEYTLDDSGRKIGLILKDSLDFQISTAEGVHQFHWTNHTDESVIQSHVDSLGQPVVFRADIPFERIRLVTSKLGYSNLVTNLDLKDQPMDHQKEGYATLKLFFDEFGNELGWAHLDAEGKLVDLQNEFGHAQWLYEKQFRDRTLGLMESFRESYYDKAGDRVENEEGVHQVQYWLNEHGDLTKIAYYNAELLPHMHASSDFYRAEIIYDSLGHRTAVRKYDTNGRLIP